MCNLSDLVEERGERKMLKSLVEKKLLKGLSAEEIADIFEESIEKIKGVIKEIEG